MKAVEWWELEDWIDVDDVGGCGTGKGVVLRRTMLMVFDCVVDNEVDGVSWELWGNATYGNVHIILK